MTFHSVPFDGQGRNASDGLHPAVVFTFMCFSSFYRCKNVQGGLYIVVHYTEDLFLSNSASHIPECHPVTAAAVAYFG
jgi:hypothetical protein